MPNPNEKIPDGKVEEIQPLTIDDLGQRAIRKIARIGKAYENMNANEVANMILRKAIRQVCNAELEGKHKAAFKSYVTVNRKMDKVAELSLSDYLAKYQSAEDVKMLSDLKTYGDK